MMLRRGFLKRIGVGCAGLWLGMGLAKFEHELPVDQSEWVSFTHFDKVTIVYQPSGEVLYDGPAPVSSPLLTRPRMGTKVV